MQHRYFAASNSAQGFKSYYNDIFECADHVYIIKGGPGTGKSSFMKRQAMRAEGLGKRCEYYYCSSDPSSLDGVLICDEKKTVAILDGTPPHLCEPQFPGAREEIINLGQFWNSELLDRQKNEIFALSERKSAEFRRAYTFLRSVGNLRAVTDGIISELVDIDKLTSYALRLLRHFPKGSLSYVPSLLDSVSMRGRIRLDSFAKNAKKLYVVSEFYGVEHIFLDRLFLHLKNCNLKARISFHPIFPEHVDGIFIENERIAFVSEKNAFDIESDDYSSECEIIRVNSKRFVDLDALRDVRSELRYTSRLAQSSLDGALFALSRAKIYHFLLEDIYGKAMDWNNLADLDIKI